MEKRVVLNEVGGPEAMLFESFATPEPGPGEIVLRHTAVGLNFIDTYHRRGIYPVPLPSGLGVEAAGEVIAIGEGVTGWALGDRAATFGPTLGAYATARIYRPEALFKLPDDISSDIAAAALLKACTVEFLVERCARVQPGQDVLVHAAAGGVGLLLVQWLKSVGARVIGTVSTEEKAALARKAGADDIILYSTEAVAPAVRALTNNKGVEVTFDGIGRATWEASLDSAARRGLIVNYGNADAPVEGISLGVLALKGSLFNTRPTLYHYYETRDDRAAGISRVWDMIRSGVVQVTIGQRYALDDVGQAHADLQGRKTSGSTILIP